MTVFSMRGSKIQTDPDGQITHVSETVLEAVTRIGTNSLEIAYLGDPQNPFAVSLSDYNLLIDKVHINDGDLPSQVEYFDLAADDGYSARILNFVYETTHGIEERMFSVGLNPLPPFATPSDASLFFAQHEPVKIMSYDDWTIPLDRVSNVNTKGVFIETDIADLMFNDDSDGFTFIESNANPTANMWDTEFANAIDLDDALTRAFGLPKNKGDLIEAELADHDTAEPVAIDLNDG